MDFRILGPLEVAENGRTLQLGRGKQRALLALLLLRPNQVVAQDRLVDALWGESPPATASTALHGYVSRLRKLLGGDRLQTRPPGYVLRLDPGELDLHRFERLLDEGHHGEALALWRGPALADLAFESFAQGEIGRLEELRLTALEGRIEGDLAEGRHAHVVGELEALVREHPLRERFYGQLILALYRSGRQAEALDVYAAARSTLVEELGLEPGERLRELQRQILEQDPALAAAPPSPPEVQPRSEETPGVERVRRARKTVTVLFCDFVDSTVLGNQLDAEVVDEILERYYEVAAGVIHRHGGTVVKFVGDALMAVFGVPTLHEDDALRAVRTGFELGPALSVLSDALERDWGIRIDVKVAVNTGEVIVGENSRGYPRLAGDALNVAPHLEQELAGRGGVVLGHRTYQLVGHLVGAEALREGQVSDAERPVRAWRLVTVEETPVFARRPSAFVGRRQELAQLQEALAAVHAQRICLLCTVVGAPGIGKSRLAREFIDGAGSGARVVAGRCLSYGERTTYWPLRDAVRELAGDEPRDWIKRRLSGDSRAAAIAERIAAAIGEGTGGAQPEETFWAFRKLFETVAAERPLVLVLDDIQWAERTLIDLLDHVARLSVGAPILILCLARPELYEHYPDWAIPHPSRVVVSLPPLSHAESMGLVERLERANELPEHALARVVETAEGNPLFLEQLLAFESEGVSAELPPSIEALLAARIERLAADARSVLACAAIEGRTFHRDAVEELLSNERVNLDEQLLTLVRKDLIEPHRAGPEAGETYRFRHVLLRDAAYEASPKASRAELHERHAAWLERQRGEDEIVGYHLEQAARYHTEVSPANRHRNDLAVRGAERLGAAGRAALNRGDIVGAVNLLSRATALPPPESSVRLQLLPDFADALSSVGAIDRARAVVGEATEQAIAAEDVRTQRRAQLQELWLRLQADPSTDIAQILRDARTAITDFEQDGDDRALAHAWHLIAWLQTNYGRLSDLGAAAERGVAHARAVGDAMTEEDLTILRLLTGPTGPLPLSEVVAFADAALDRARQGGSRRVEMASLITLAMCAAFRKEFDQARELISEAKAIDEDVGGGRGSGFQYWPAGLVELLAGDAQRAEHVLRDGYETLRRRGDNWWMCGVAAELADALWLQGRDDEALEMTRISRETTAKDDPVGEMMWRGARAKVLARRGEGVQAEALAREALAIIEPTDYVVYHGDALSDLAEVLRLLNRPDEAATIAEEARRIYERKGNIAAAEAARAAQR